MDTRRQSDYLSRLGERYMASGYCGRRTAATRRFAGREGLRIRVVAKRPRDRIYSRTGDPRCCPFEYGKVILAGRLNGEGLYKGSIEHRFRFVQYPGHLTSTTATTVIQPLDQRRHGHRIEHVCKRRRWSRIDEDRTALN